MKAISFAQILKHTTAIFDRITQNNETLVVKAPNGQSVVMMSLSEYNSLMETWYLMKSPANYASLLKSIAQIESGEIVSRDEMIAYFGPDHEFVRGL